MKKYLLALIILLFVLNVSAQCTAHPKVYSKKYVIGTPIKLGNIEIAQHLVVRSPTKGNDTVECFLNYYQALYELKKLGDGWRLPTIEEYYMIDKINYQSNGNFLFYPVWYWCEGLSKDNRATRFYFTINDTNPCFIGLLSPYHPMGLVMAVRDIK